MKKRLLGAGTAILLAGAVCLTGCEFSIGDFFPQEHRHQLDESQWQHDAAGHWRACYQCEEKVNYGTHRYESESSTACLDCGYLRTVSGGEEPEPSAPVVGEPITDDYILAHAASDYGFKWLAGQANGEKLQAYYRSIDELAGKVMQGNFTVSEVEASGNTYLSAGKLSTSELSLSEVKTVYSVYCYDHPYNFWQSQVQLTGYVTSGTNTTNHVHLVVADGYEDRVKFTSTQSQLNGSIKEAYAAADGAEDNYEVAAAYYRALALRADYAYESEGVPSDAFWAHGIVGIFDDDPATGPVCEGYARAFQLLLNLRGVDNVYCVGYATGAGTGGGGGHAWNMVKLEDGKWYHFDLTWDDGNDSDGGKGGTLRYDYFAVSAADSPRGAAFSATHYAGSPENANGYFLYDLPAVSMASYANDFAIGKTLSDASFEYIRNGMNTVGIRRIKTTVSPVRVPARVTLNQKVYTVTEIGPYINEKNNYMTVLTGNYNRSIILPDTIEAICTAAFYCNGKITVYYRGTREGWSKISLGEEAFHVTPTVYCLGEWDENTI